MPEAEMQFLSGRQADGSATTDLTAVGELSAEQQRLMADRRVLDLEIARAGRAAFQQFGSAELPTAEDLGCDVTGLSPARSALARLMRWRETLETEAARLETELATLTSSPPSNAADDVRHSLAALERAERDEFAAWLRGGSAGARPALKTEQRSRLEAQLADCDWQDGVRREAIRETEIALTERRAAISALTERRRDLVRDVLREAAEPVAAEIGRMQQGEIADVAREIDALFARMDVLGNHLAAKYKCLLALGSFLGTEQPAMAVSLPHRPNRIIRPEECGPATDAWREFARALETDPHAQSEETER